MTFLLDTNAVSEWTKPQPNAGLIRWLDGVDEDRVYLSVVTLAELRHGVELLAKGKRRSALESWLSHDVPLRFDGRILGVDEKVADLWGRALAVAQRAGKSVGTMDCLLAAISLRHALSVVTRNAADFEPFGVTTVNPWS